MPTRTPIFSAVVAGAVLAGCITGERPTLVDETIAAIDDETVRIVHDRLSAAPDRTFTAEYSIIPTSSGAITEATIEVNGTARRITIGDVEFLTDGEASRTCVGDTADCVGHLDDAAISNLHITHRFWGDAFAARLRLDAARRVGFPGGSAVEIAGLPASCVDLPLPGIGTAPATVRYCALDTGPLARYVGADVSIELTSYVGNASAITF